MSLDEFLDRQQSPKYWCGDLAREIWLKLTGRDVQSALGDLLAADAVGMLRPRHVRALAAIPEPVDPCLVIMRKPRAALHMGVFVGGKVMHLTTRGVEYLSLELASRSFQSLRFYVC